MSTSTFLPSLPLNYLGLPSDYAPSPEHEPIAFLTKHLSQLPPHILNQFSNITTAKQRTLIPTIRNRRLKYTSGMPRELSFDVATTRWPQMWAGRGRVGREEGEDEKDWANSAFLDGQKQHLGKLGNLLGNYEEEREAERARTLRRQTVSLSDDFVPEEEDSESEIEATEEESEEESRETFERLIRERFIYGLLEDIDYDCVDWDESLEDDREAEEHWFDEEEETS
ncbi:hypothetical protein M378DRAFT_183797 [Amanita muscaria Koide BX008]|uniref:CCD97-like C-terminal domain-containing protein n=1 Tax=Amanita muscaria (strain Koide BX008) TaxID=946122 RepID=A0A0C2XL37_AMAMK|nr:hypothetical protein M378DRAFT_183797 [Amanita muscaria Koide BX008]